MDIISNREAETFLQLQSGTGGEFLDRVITDVSAMLAVWTGRTDWGPASERTEYHDGGDEFIVTDYWPIASIASIYEDSDHVWGSTTLISSDDYRSGDLGFVWLETAPFVGGADSVKITYTGGYASTSAIPDAIKSAGLRQLEHEYNKRKRQGGRSGFASGEMLPEVGDLIKPYTRRINFA